MNIAVRLCLCALFFLTPGMSPGAFDIEVMVESGDGEWVPWGSKGVEADAEPSRWGHFPPPLAGVSFPGGVAQDARLFLRAGFEVPEDGPAVAVSLVGVNESGLAVTFPVREVEPGGGVAGWSLAPRPMTGVELSSATLSLAAVGSLATSATLRFVEVVDEFDLPTRELLDASPFRPFNLRHVSAPGFSAAQDAVIILPECVKSRYPNGRVEVLRGGAHEATANLAEMPAEAGYLTWRPVIGLGTGGRQEVEALLVTGDSSEDALLLGRQWFHVLEEDRVFGQFEVPYADIADFVVSDLDPDIRLVTLNADLYAPGEPAGFGATYRELNHIVMSEASGRYESEAFWRSPWSGSWDEAGLSSLGIGRRGRNVLLHVSGAGAGGVEVVGLAAATGRSSARAAASNPVYAPAPTVTGWIPGQALAVRGNNVIPRLDGFMMATVTAADGGHPMLVRSISQEMVNWTAVGSEPAPSADSMHLAPLVYDGRVYFTGDSATTIWSAESALGELRPVAVDFPVGWSRFRIEALKGKYFLFGLEEVDGRRVVRWVPLSWKADETGMPIPWPEPSEAGGRGL